MMLSMFNLSVSAIGPGFVVRPGLHRVHLATKMALDLSLFKSA